MDAQKFAARSSFRIIVIKTINLIQKIMPVDVIQLPVKDSEEGSASIFPIHPSILHMSVLPLNFLFSLGFHPSSQPTSSARPTLQTPHFCSKS